MARRGSGRGAKRILRGGELEGESSLLFEDELELYPWKRGWEVDWRSPGGTERGDVVAVEEDALSGLGHRVKK
jgi:hypothetical protein